MSDQSGEGPKMDGPTIEYRDGKMIVTHPSGVVNEYTRADLEAVRQAAQDQRQKIDTLIADLDAHLQAIDDSLRGNPK